MRSSSILVGFVLFLGGLTACKTDSVTQLPPPEATRTPTWTPTRELPRFTASPTTSTTPEATDSVLVGDVLPGLVATSQPVPLLCSPLAETSLEELPEIVSDPYHPPPMGKDDRHQGVDFSYYRRGERLSIEGEIVQSILPGKVATVLADRLPYGNMVMIETPQEGLDPRMVEWLGLAAGESLYHLYAHLGETPEVELGQSVECGQTLGIVGKTGYNIINPHLHLELRIGPAGTVFENMAFYDTRATPEEMENYRRWRMSGEFQHLDPMALFDFYLEKK
jgi:murein DD-endopeptidase MepM/ murein hydrolase activator NlpD